MSVYPIPTNIIARLGIRQWRNNTLASGFNSLLEGPLYLDPATNPSVIELNGLASNSSSLYGIVDNELDLSHHQRTVEETFHKGRHGSGFSDYQFVNRLVKFKLKINSLSTNPARPSGVSSVDWMIQAKNQIENLLNDAYDYSVSTSTQNGTGVISGQPVILMVQLANSSNPFYLDVLGGQVDSKGVFSSINLATDFAEITVDLVCKYTARGDYVYLNNAVINGNSEADSYFAATTQLRNKYWVFDASPYFTTFLASAQTPVNIIPPIADTGHLSALRAYLHTSVGSHGTATGLVYSTPFVITYQEKLILDFWAAASVTNFNSSNVVVSLQVSRLTSATDSTPTGGWTTLTSTTISSLAASVPTALPGQYTGQRFSLAVVDTSTYSAANSVSTYLLVRVAFAANITNDPTYATSDSLFFNRVAIWRYPVYLPNTEITAPASEYINIIPMVQTDAMTTVYDVRGQIASPTRIKATPYWQASTAKPGGLQTISLGMRQRQGTALPKYLYFGASGVSSNVASSASINWPSAGYAIQTGAGGQFSSFNDSKARNYKIYLICTTNTPTGFGLKIAAGGGLTGNYFTRQLLPSSYYPFLPSTNGISKALVDCGTFTIPANGSGNTTAFTLSGAGLIYTLYSNYLQGITTAPTTPTFYEMYMLPCDQFFYCDTRHIPIAVASYGLADGLPGWCYDAQMIIDSLQETVTVSFAPQAVLPNANAALSDFAPEFLNNPLRLYPAHGRWRNPNSTTSYTLTADDRMPTEIGFLTTLPDASQPDYIQKSNNMVGTDCVIGVEYYPLYNNLSDGL